VLGAQFRDSDQTIQLRSAEWLRESATLVEERRMLRVVRLARRAISFARAAFIAE
jgi:hypothetical protein